jgi:hypothetical protein
VNVVRAVAVVVAEIRLRFRQCVSVVRALAFVVAEIRCFPNAETIAKILMNKYKSVSE